MVWVQSTRTNGRVAKAVVDSLASLMQARRLRGEVGGQNLTTNPDNRPDETKEWTTPLAFGLDSRFSSGKEDMG